MSSEVVSRLETLLARVVGRRSLPRAVPVAPVAVVTSPAPKAIAPEPLRPDAPRLEARTPVVEAPTVEANLLDLARSTMDVAPEVPIVAEAPKPVAPVAEAPKPVVVAEAPKPVFEELDLDGPDPVRPAAKEPAASEAPPLPTPPVEPTVVSRRALDPLSVAPPRANQPAPAPAPAASKSPFADDRIAASFAGGNAASPGFGEDDADHVETLAFRVGRALPKSAQVPAPPLPVTSRDEPSSRPERFTPSLPVAPVAAQIVAAAPSVASTSLRSLVQRSVALRPRG